MDLDLLPNENIVNICNFLNYDELNNLRLVSKKFNNNINYFLKVKIKEIRTLINNCSDYYLLNIVWHLNNYESLSLDNIVINKNIFRVNEPNNYIIRYTKGLSKISVNYNDNKRKIELWYINGINNNRLGPALLRWRDNGTKECFIWYKEGKFHNEKGPSIIKWYENGIKEQERYYLNGVNININRNTPLIRRWYNNGQMSFESYYINEVSNNARYFPEFTRWYDNENKKLELYSRTNNYYYRENLPCLSRWHKNGNKDSEIYSNKDNIICRIIRWNKEGIIIYDKEI